jgi:hypothetical protein
MRPAGPKRGGKAAVKCGPYANSGKLDNPTPFARSKHLVLGSAQKKNLPRAHQPRKVLVVELDSMLFPVAGCPIRATS